MYRVRQSLKAESLFCKSVLSLPALFAAFHRMKRTLTLGWGLLRLPLLGLGMYLFRFQIAAFIENTFELWRVMDMAVYFASTFITRLLAYAGLVLALGFGFWLGEKFKMPRALILAGAFAGIFSSFAYLFKTGEPLTRAIAAVALLAANTLPHDWLTKRIASGGVLSAVCAAGAGLVEALFPQGYLLWLANQFGAGDSLKRWSWLAGVIAAPALWMVVLVPPDNQRMLTLGERLHASPAVERFAEGDFNWIEFHAETRTLYAVGRATNYLLAFDADALAQPPRKSRKPIGKTQSFAFNPEHEEIYAYKADTGELVYLDSRTLETLRTVPVPDLSPGDVWLKWHRLTDTITLSSEADAEVGTPLFVFDRASGEIVARMPLPVIPTAYLVWHPDKPWLYFNSFRDTYLAVWDLPQKEIVRQTETRPRTDRMIYNAAGDELWVASPLDGAILRYEAETLAYKGEIAAGFGVRTLTLDTQRRLLLTGNFINNRLQVFELNTMKPVASFYLGPWIRTIALDEERGIAYVSTARGLFRVDYAASGR